MPVLVKEVMLKVPDVVTISNKATIGEAVEMFATKEVGCMPMLDERGNLVGFLTDGDIVYYVVNRLRLMQTIGENYKSRYPDPRHSNYFSMLLKHCTNEPAYDAASHRVVTIGEDDTVRRATELMHKKSIKDIPVLDENHKLVGLITHNDIIMGLFNEYLEDPEAVCIDF